MVILLAQFLSRGLPPPLANPTVKCGHLAILELTRVAALQDEKERSGLQIWCLFQVLHDFRPYLGKVVWIQVCIRSPAETGMGRSKGRRICVQLDRPSRGSLVMFMFADGPALNQQSSLSTSPSRLATKTPSPVDQWGLSYLIHSPCFQGED